MKHKPTVTRSHCSLFLHFYILRFPDMFFILWNITAQSALTDWTMFCFVVSVFVPVSVCLGLCILLYLGLNKKYVFRVWIWELMNRYVKCLFVSVRVYDRVWVCPHVHVSLWIATLWTWQDHNYKQWWNLPSVFSPCSPVCACVCNICHPWQHAPC